MEIINLECNPSGAYSAIQSWSQPVPPEGFAEVRCDTSVFYEYNGFVTLETVQESVSLDEGSAAVVEEDAEPELEGAAEDTDAEVEEDSAAELEDAGNTVEITVVIGMMPNVEAWEAWKATLPEPQPEPERQPTDTEVLNVLLGVTD